jgi:hypothetical protein
MTRGAGRWACAIATTKSSVSSRPNEDYRAPERAAPVGEGFERVADLAQHALLTRARGSTAHKFRQRFKQRRHLRQPGRCQAREDLAHGRRLEAAREVAERLERGEVGLALAELGNALATPDARTVVAEEGFDGGRLLSGSPLSRTTWRSPRSAACGAELLQLGLAADQ